MSTGVVTSDKLKGHDTGKGHPESPARLDAVARAIEAPGLSDKLVRLKPRRASVEEILLVHWERLYEEVLATAGQERAHLDSDTVTSADSSDLAHLAVGTVLVGVDQVLTGKVDNVFAFPRPPGHHAKPDKAMGFCIFNNVAIAARYAQQEHKLKRVLIIDFDVHHGNGTQKAFYTSPEVLYISIHQSPHFPGTGSVTEMGKDEGEGFTVNIPMTAGSDAGDYVQMFREVIEPVGREFAPELVLVSAGFDAHADDPLGSMQVSSEGFGAITRNILDISDATCQGRSVFALEGGYHLGALEQSTAAVLDVMSGGAAPEVQPSAKQNALIEQIRKVHGESWKSLSG